MSQQPLLLVSLMYQIFTPLWMLAAHSRRHTLLTSGVTCLYRRRKDKWFNTGGIKSASDRFDPVSNLGLRKRYGKVVREGDLPVLKFQEFSLLRKAGETLVEEKNGPTLFHIMPPDAKRGAQISVTRPHGTAPLPIRLLGELTTVQRQVRELQDELAAANATIQRQSEELERVKRGGVVTRRRRFKLPPGC